MLSRVSCGDSSPIVLKFIIWIKLTLLNRFASLFKKVGGKPNPYCFSCRMWKVFYDDINRPNRYLLAKELPMRPDATEIEVSLKKKFPFSYLLG